MLSVFLGRMTTENGNGNEATGPRLSFALAPWKVCSHKFIHKNRIQASVWPSYHLQTCIEREQTEELSSNALRVF